MDKKQCIKNNYSLNKINNKKNKNNNKKHKGNFDYKYNLYNDYKCKNYVEDILNNNNISSLCNEISKKCN